MKTIILLSIYLLNLQTSAQIGGAIPAVFALKANQKIELTILLRNAKIQNDSLYFRYRIQNNSDTTFVLYNAGIVDFITAEIFEEEYKNYATGLTMFIYDENDQYQLPKWASWERFRYPGTPLSYEERIDSLFYGKYIVLDPGEAVEYDRRLYVDISELKKGIYNFQLRYFSFLDRYRQQYANAKKKNVRLKNSVLFEGEVRSNFCSFEVVAVKETLETPDNIGGYIIKYY